MSVSQLFFKILKYGFCFFLLTGFRIFPTSSRWNISVADPTLWVSFCERPVFTANDLPAGDPLSGLAINFDSLIQSVFDDYNNINSSYVILADAATDPAYNAALATERTINVCFKSLPVGAAGTAGLTRKGSVITGCTISIIPGMKDSARSFVSVFTHELGHCLGLDHPQDTTHAIMSYFRSEGMIRLQIDDKMGMAYIFSSNPEEVRETANLGFSCAPK